MRRSKEDTAKTRQEIVEAASRLFRKRGIAGVSVADVMGELGLTVGGFYRHFESKDALVAEAIEVASRATARTTGTLQQLVDSYVSKGHCDHPEEGCPVAALASEISREAPGTRAAFTAAVERMVQAIGTVKRGRREQLQTAAAAVGGVMLARAV
jgi:TetR/AcrR family transcriptional repressor of nem operon